ncbi:MAG: CTP synthase [Nanoarchaeota archaeon]
MREKLSKPKFIFISGGVISSVGKGIFTASLACLIESQGYKVEAIKIDPYINVDAGTMRPTEHGEVFVTADGFETDQDLGSYERFSSMITTQNQSLTTGQIYLKVINDERSGKFNGKCVEVVPHIPQEVIKRICKVQSEKNADFVLVEVGGSVGEYQAFPFLEASRMMKGLGMDTAQIHVGYIPTPTMVGEQKTKPIQESIKKLREQCGNPDFVVARSHDALDNVRKQKISMSSGLPLSHIISAFDDDLIYRIPLNLANQNLHTNLLHLFGLPFDMNNCLKEWREMVAHIEKLQSGDKIIKIGIVGKYFSNGNFSLSDSYISVIEAVKHASWHNDNNVKICAINAKDFEDKIKDIDYLKEFDGIIIPGGFGDSGISGKIEAIKFCRENKIPFLGLCLGMQLSVIEFARNVLNLKDANSTEFHPSTTNPVISLLEEQLNNVSQHHIGGTMRLGSYTARLKAGTIVSGAYASLTTTERHRHRWEVNNKYRADLEAAGLVVSGVYEQKNLVEFIELPQNKHPFFVGTQAHPEFQSRFLRPSPLFNKFISAVIKNKG